MLDEASNAQHMYLDFAEYLAGGDDLQNKSDA